MTSPRTEPLFFGPDDRPLFGWLHRPSSMSTAGVGLVVCSPVGYEAVCVHRSLRHLASAATAVGLPTLRFDFDGTGDSAGDDYDPGRVRAWVESVHHAADTLRHVTGVGRVFLFGVRLGATLALLAAIDRDDVAAIVAIAPVVTGRAYVRELRVLETIRGLMEPTPENASAGGVQSVVGFALTDETVTKLMQVDLTHLERRPAAEVLLLERDDLANNNGLLQRFVELGARVEQRRAAGYVEMMLDPHLSLVPEVMIADVTAWLSKRAPCAALVDKAVATRASALVPAEIGSVPIEEAAVFVDPDRTLFGIVSVTAGRVQSGRKGILLLNAGAVHHVGPNRLYVSLARRWASRGHVVLRLDLAGLGESQPRSGEKENVVYSVGAHKDIATALTYLRGLPGVVECHVLGLCSGAYNAFTAAVAGLPIDGVVLINPLTFSWKPGASLTAAAHHVASESARYGRSARSLAAWKKLLKGQFKISSALEVVARRASALAIDRAHSLARLVGAPLPGDLGAKLVSVARRNISMMFVFAETDPGLDLLQRQGGSTVNKLQKDGRLIVRIIDGADHTFTPLKAQDRLATVLTEHLDSSR